MKNTLKIAKQCYWGNGVGVNFKQSFARIFKRELTIELSKFGATLTKFTVGHYIVSGFFQVKGQCYYFSLSDIRHFEVKEMLWRTAKDEKDYTGGRNRYAQLNDEMGESIGNQIYMDANKISFLLV